MDRELSAPCPKCRHPRIIGQERCTSCGVVFRKYAQYLKRLEEGEPPGIDRGNAAGQGRFARAAGVLLDPPDSMYGYWWAYLLLWAAFVVWGWSYIGTGMTALGLDPGFMHAINLPFHEFGHILFGIFGEWIGSLGGTLGQLAMPIICGVALMRHHADTFGLSLCLWWLGQNFLDVAPYMADARAGELPLLGGNYGKSSPYGFHDWEYILGETGLLAHDQVLATITMNSGRLLMVIAMVWGAWLLWRSRVEDQ